jgi:trimeric autotransporter adhesin
MTSVRHAAALAILLVLPLALTGLEAQSDILLQLEAGNPPGDRFAVDSAGGLLARGTLGIGTIPATGEGIRLMWYPRRAAFRAGGSGGNNWDHGNVGDYSTAFGIGNAASGFASTALGEQTTASGWGSTAMGGWFTTASGGYATAMGESTTASGGASLATGSFTHAGGFTSIATGWATAATGDYSAAMGVRARAAHAGSFVWGSTTTGGGDPQTEIGSSAIGQFSARAVGGVRFFTNIGMTAGMALAAGGSTWNAVSDRARKENFASVDGEGILARLRAVPVTSWNYLAEGREVRHIGPMAQDWHAAFALNDDSLTINQGDFDGINLAAIQALDARTEGLPALAAEVEALRTELARRDGRLVDVEAELAWTRAEAATLRQRLEVMEARFPAPITGQLPENRTPSDHSARPGP